MKARELYMRCVKARIVSWLNSTTVGAVLPAGDTHVVLAVYHNGKYVEPEPIHIPNSPAEMWGPDGPIYRSMQQQSEENKPDEGEEQEEDKPDDSEQD